jgi:hypothetical protein
MPCDQVRTTTVEWSEATDLKMVASAMLALGFERVRIEGQRVMGYDPEQAVDVWLEGGRLRVRQSYGEADYDASALKQRYAAEVVKDRWSALG